MMDSHYLELIVAQIAAEERQRIEAKIARNGQEAVTR